MPASTRHIVVVLLMVFHVVPDLLLPWHARQALATSLELRLSSDISGDDIRVEEDEVKVVRFNYTLSVTGDANHTLALAVCVTVDDLEIAHASVSKDTIVPLHADLLGAFNVTLVGKFVGRANLHVHFVVGHHDQVRCGQPGAKNLQELLRVSEANQEMAMNVTRTSSSGTQNSTSSSSSSSSSSSPTPSPSASSGVDVHSGRSYQVVVLRPERPIDVVFQIGAVILVVVINVGMGSKLDLQVVKATLRRPFAPVTGLCSQFIVMPLVSFGVTQIFDLTPGVALGFFAMGCSPGGSASNVFCYLLGGDVSLSITMTFVSTVASIGLMPLWLFSLGRYVAKTHDIQIPFANILYSLLGLVAAVGVGLFLKAKKPTWAKVAVTVSKAAFVVLIIFFLTVGVYANLYIFSLMEGQVLLGAAILPYTGFLLGGLVAMVLRMPAKNVVTIAIETGIQNVGVAMIVLLLSLDHPESDLSIVAPAASSMFTPIPLWISVCVYQLRRRYLRKKNAATKDGPTDPETQTTAQEGSPAENAPGGSLCEKIFGKDAGPAACWRKSCWMCLSSLDAKSQAPREIEIVVPEAADDSGPSRTSTSEKPHPYAFDNLAAEREEVAEKPRDEGLDGSGSEDGKGRSENGNKATREKDPVVLGNFQSTVC